MKRTNYHVVKDGAAWHAKVDGQSVDAHSKKAELLRQLRIHCRVMWKSHGVPSELHIHGKDGIIKSKDTYGNDPVETKG